MCQILFRQARLKGTYLDKYLKKYFAKLCQAQLSGLTRLEVSIYPDARDRYNPMLPSIKTLWHLRMQCALDELASGVLNNSKVMC